MNDTTMGVIPQEAQGARHGRPPSLSMTDYGFLFAMLLALFVIVIDDGLGWRLEKIAITKHLPALFSLLPLLLALAGWRLFRPRQQPLRVLPILWPLLTLAVFMIVGGLYARISLGQSNTFMTPGLYVWAAPLAATMLVRSDHPQRLLRNFFLMLMLAGALAFYGLAANYGGRQVYHELEYLFPPLAVYAAFAAKKSWLRWAGVTFFLVFAMLYKKNTGYVAALLVLAYLVFFYVRPHWSRLKDIRKVGALTAFVMAVLMLAAALAYVWANRETYLPTGNIEFRSQTYERAWSRFKESPLWGDGFTAPSTERFTGFDTGVARNVLPTHSDILDILAQGGLLAFVIWLWGLVRIGRRAYAALLRPDLQPHPLRPYAHTLACMALAGVLVYAFNPIFMQPVKALLLWGSLGMLAGMTLLAERDAGLNNKQGNKQGGES